jgi:hypothetical protein
MPRDATISPKHDAPTMKPRINELRDHEHSGFESMRSFCCAIGRAWVALLIMSAAGCAKDATKKKNARENPEKIEATAKGTASGASGAQKTQSKNVWQPRLGKILLVKDKLEFVLIDIGTAPAPEAGTRLLAYTDANPSAELAVSSFQKRPFLIADIVSGEPKVGDAVVADLAPRTQPPADSRNSGPTPPPASSRDEPPKLGSSKSRSSQSAKESAARDPFQAPGSADPRLGPEDPQLGEGIIPGLPPRSFR